jgi:hypothetical protein
MLRAAALVALAAALLPALASTTVEPLVDRRLLLRASHMCGTQGRYAPGSAYEANLRRLATVAAEVNASPCNCSAGSVVGRRPDQVTASAYCYRRLSSIPSANYMCAQDIHTTYIATNMYISNIVTTRLTIITKA